MGSASLAPARLTDRPPDHPPDRPHAHPDRDDNTPPAWRAEE